MDSARSPGHTLTYSHDSQSTTCDTTVDTNQYTGSHREETVVGDGAVTLVRFLDILRED